MPTRRHTTCFSPGRISSPYSNVARPSSAHVISQMPLVPPTRFTLSPARILSRFRSVANFFAASRNASMSALANRSKSRSNRRVLAQVDKYSAIEGVEELVVGLVGLNASGLYVTTGFSLSSLPGFAPEPSRRSPCLDG